jgi:hypothetical protein
MSKITDHQLRQLLHSSTKCPAALDTHNYPTLEDVLQELYSSGPLNLPCESGNIFMIEERIPVFADIRSKRSRLVAQLMDRSEETGLVADALIGGKESLYLARLVSTSEVESWLRAMNDNTMEIYVKAWEDLKLCVAPLRAFISLSGEA